MVGLTVKNFNIGVGVSGVVVNKNKILLGKRKDLGTWGLPGGRVEEGETIEESLFREVEEETGIRVKESKLTGIYIRTRWKKNLVFVFVCKNFSGNLRCGEETSEVKWFPLEQVSRTLDKNIVIRVNDALANEKNVFVRVQNRVRLSLLIYWLIKYSQGKS